MKIKNLVCSFYQKLYLVYDCDEEQLVRHLDKDSGAIWKVMGRIGTTFYYEDTKGQLKVVFWMRPKMSVAETIKNIYHETGHCLVYIFEEIGVKIDRHTDEIFLYAQENIVNQVLALFNKSK